MRVRLSRAKHKDSHFAELRLQHAPFASLRTDTTRNDLEPYCSSERANRELPYSARKYVGQGFSHANHRKPKGLPYISPFTKF